MSADDLRVRQLPLALAPAPAAAGFEELVVGRNGVALAHLQALVDGLVHGPLYLWGPAGSGKTRWLQAAAATLAQRAQPVLWVQPGMPWPPELAQDTAMVLVDDAHALDAEAQQRLFALLIDAQGQGVGWMAAGLQPPVDLPLRDDLRSRLGWGAVHALLPLPDEDLAQALAAEARRRGFAIPPAVLAWLMRRAPRDLNHLMGLLDHLDRYTLAAGREVTVPLLKQMLEDNFPPVETA